MVQLEKIIADELALKLVQPGFEDLFVVEIQVSPGPKIAVFLDSDVALTIARCTEMSRYLENFLETNGHVGERYTLEVSSPGVGKPLKFERQFVKNIGRLLTVHTHDSVKALEGKLVAADKDKIVLEWEEKIAPEGKKKKELVKMQAEIPYANIKNAVVQIVFGPLDDFDDEDGEEIADEA